MDISEVPEVGKNVRGLMEFLDKRGDEDVGDSDLTTTIARLATAQLARKAKATKSIWKREGNVVAGLINVISVSLKSRAVRYYLL